MNSISYFSFINYKSNFKFCLNFNLFRIYLFIILYLYNMLYFFITAIHYNHLNLVYIAIYYFKYMDFFL